MEFSGRTLEKTRLLKDQNDNESTNCSELIVSRKVKSIRQLKNSQKEWVRLCYKEAILKGFTLVKDIQLYIASKTKIWIEIRGLEYLKKSEAFENKKWYYHMAKDQLVYISVYRKCIDELELVKRECWRLISNPKTSYSIKVKSLREIHSVTQTIILLLRDLPFVTNLSNYYDQEKVDLMFSKDEDLH